MDKCILKAGDVDRLFAWRDKHKELVRRCPQAMKGIEIIVEDEQARLVCVRESPDTVVIRASLNNNAYRFNMFLKIVSFGRFQLVKSTGQKLPDDVQDSVCNEACSIYASLMALLVYGDDVDYTEKELDVIDEVVKERRAKQQVKNKRKKQQQSIVYLLNRDKTGRVSVGGRGHHNSPKGEFRVRGHFRHYTNGNVVWIDEFKKGTGKRKDKVYKL